MTIRPARHVALALLLAGAVPVAASAQTAPAAPTAGAIMPGMTVVDPSGAIVGTVSSVNGDQLIVKTPSHEVQLPASSFTPSKGKLLFALTQAQLDAQAAEALAAANAKLTVGTNVYGPAGTQAGTITAIDDQLVTLKLTNGKSIRLNRNSVAPSANGAVMAISAADLQKLADQAQ